MSQATDLTPELIRELAALRDEAGGFLSTQKSYSQYVHDILEGKTALTNAARAKVDEAVMVTRQMAFNVHRCITAARGKLPEGYADGDGRFWHAHLHDLHSQSTKDHDQAISAARTIQSWSRVVDPAGDSDRGDGIRAG